MVWHPFNQSAPTFPHVNRSSDVGTLCLCSTPRLNAVQLQQPPSTQKPISDSTTVSPEQLRQQTNCSEADMEGCMKPEDPGSILTGSGALAQDGRRTVVLPLTLQHTVTMVVQACAACNALSLRNGTRTNFQSCYCCPASADDATPNPNFCYTTMRQRYS